MISSRHEMQVLLELCGGPIQGQLEDRIGGRAYRRFRDGNLIEETFVEGTVFVSVTARGVEEVEKMLGRPVDKFGADR